MKILMTLYFEDEQIHCLVMAVGVQADRENKGFQSTDGRISRRNPTLLRPIWAGRSISPTASLLTVVGAHEGC